jgi:hypothetical protein
VPSTFTGRSREGSGRTPSRAAAPPRRVRRVPARSSDAPRLRRGVEDIARAVRSGRCDADGGAATRVTQPLDFLKLSRCLNGTGGSRQKQRRRRRGFHFSRRRLRYDRRRCRRSSCRGMSATS